MPSNPSHNVEPKSASIILTAIVDVCLNVHSLSLVVPSDARVPNLPALVLDTGRLKLRSDLAAKEKIEQTTDSVTIRPYFYSAYTLKW